MTPQVSIGQEIPLTIKRLGINGEGIGYYKHQAVFVKGALIGEEYAIRIDEVFDGYATGHPVRQKIVSPSRVKPFCEYYERCGGCSLQHMTYEAQLKEKKELIIEAIERYTNINPRGFEIRETIACANPYGYRNKSSLPVCFDGEKSILGIYEAETNKVVYVDSCKVQNEEVNRINKEVLKVLDKNRVFAFNHKEKKGDVRYLVTRCAVNTKEAQVTLIMYNNKVDLKKTAEDILKIDGVKSVYKDFNNDLRTHQIFGSSLSLLAGKKTITEKLGRFSFELMPNAFFQLNPIQTETLYDAIRKAAKLTKKEHVLDAYSGVGTIGIWVSDFALDVIGIESNKEAVKDAINNAKNNNIENIKFYVGEVSKVLPGIIKEGWKADVVLVDPPRTGLGEELTRSLLKSQPKRIVYTSCNPSTLAKDLKLLTSIYKVKYIQPIDMFPFTPNVEAVVLLER